MLPSSDVSDTTISKSVPAFVTETPWLCTACGSCDMACCSLFCTCIWATSAFVPASNCSRTLAVPAELLVDAIETSRSMPLRRCSITWVTESSMVLADAPV